ncbi:MAG: primosomal protein N' [Candidatus Omnitrophica bacterium]|nr:primosomal protein N' [Candidatus Omnitrophota bacterium]
MKYAKVALGIPPEGPFDYIIPREHSFLKAGSRVVVPFRNRALLGFVVGTCSKTPFKKIKEIAGVLDGSAVLSRQYLELCRELSIYYCSSWGMMIETGLPRFLARNKPFPGINGYPPENIRGRSASVELIFDPAGDKRYWYFSRIRDLMKEGMSVLIVVPEASALSDTEARIKQDLGIEPVVIMKEESFKTGARKLELLAGAEPKAFLGMRSAVFSQIKNLGLIILEDESNPVYKQEQAPCYNAREVALFRSRLEGVSVILTSQMPSLEAYNMASGEAAKLTVLEPGAPLCEVSIIDMRKEFLKHFRKKGEYIISLEMERLIGDALSSSRKVILFSNRSGFAQNIKCPSCGFTFICERCNLPLVFHLDRNLFLCRRCNYKTEVRNICPKCNAGYMHYFSFGIEKLEGELRRIFPQASIGRLDSESPRPDTDRDILVASQVVLKAHLPPVDLLGVVSVDNLLNQADFRAAEKAFALLFKLKRLCRGRMAIQTMSPQHYCFEAVKKDDYGLFYKNEFSTRKQLNLPPYRHIILVNLRGREQDKVEEASGKLFDLLKDKFAPYKHTSLIGSVRNTPFKLRGNFRRQIVINSSRPRSTSPRLKEALRDFRPSGIIVTVDVDPV